MRNNCTPALATLALCMAAACESGDPAALARAAGDPPPHKHRSSHHMSSTGRLAHRALRQLGGQHRHRSRNDRGDEVFEDDEGGGPGALEDGGELPGGAQAELSIAVDDKGQNVIIGFNDFRGFLAAAPGTRLSVSGFMVSHDGGKTFIDGGQLPITTGDPGSELPQVFGDPDVKYLGGCNFIYTSIVLAPFGDGGAAQTMGFHRTRNCGQSWEGPFEIPPATNPNGVVIEGQAADAADKELIDVDRATGRVLMSWTNFSAEPEISTTFSDDVLAPNPTWSPRVVIGDRPGIDGQGSIPRFGRDSLEVHVAWGTVTPAGLDGISVATSKDGGLTFGEPVDLTPGSFFPDQVPGNDRIHAFPTLAVDRSRGPYRGTVYVSYASNDSHDGADVVVQRSSDGGRTFSAPVAVNARPGQDRSQWFPALATNDHSGRALLFYYDQGVADSGDLTQVSFTFSDDGGSRWAAPRRLSPRTFRAGYGNDSSQPNLGDYIQSVVNRRGELLGAYAITKDVLFRDGQPGPTMTVPEPTVSIAGPGDQVPTTTVDLRGVVTTELAGHSDRNGFLDAGELAQLSIAVRNDVTNPMSARPLPAAVALVESKTPGARILAPLSLFGRLLPGETQSALTPAVLALDPGFPVGQDVSLGIKVFSINGRAVTLDAKVHTGTPIATSLLAESFDGVAAGALPAGWRAAHGAGDNEVPWTTSATFCGGSNAAFHANGDDGATPTDQARWERLLGPVVNVPADADWVTLDFDVCTDTEDEPALNVQAYDGVFLRLADLTAGAPPRSVLAEAFAQDFTTGGKAGYPKHLPRGDNPAYFEDMSVWAGDSHGPQHVSMRLPGVAGTTVQLRFEYTQDSFATCAFVRPGHACGVSIDNVRLTAFRARRAGH
ncbi:MAG TPA: exo-alpha-sialidase [Polyangia bacterium]|nr:exo-alpha-sialidase [Polyangia bacterium]